MKSRTYSQGPEITADGGSSVNGNSSGAVIGTNDNWQEPVAGAAAPDAGHCGIPARAMT